MGVDGVITSLNLTNHPLASLASVASVASASAAATASAYIPNALAAPTATVSSAASTAAGAWPASRESAGSFRPPRKPRAGESTARGPSARQRCELLGLGASERLVGSLRDDPRAPLVLHRADAGDTA